MIDFIGNGKNSRAVIRKGQLRYLVRTSTVGHIFTILDERNQVLRDASVWLTGHEYRAGKTARSRYPTAPSPVGSRRILRHQELSTLAWFEHQSEDYQLTAGMYVDREALLFAQDRKAAGAPIFTRERHARDIVRPRGYPPHRHVNRSGWCGD